MDESELDEFLLASAVSGSSRGRGAEASGSAEAREVPAAGVEGEAEALVVAPIAGAEGDEAMEMLALAAVPAGGRRRAFQARSHELLAHARTVLQNKRHSAKLAVVNAKKQKVEAQFQIRLASDHAARTCSGMPVKTVALPRSVVANLTLKLAAIPRIRSALFDAQRQKQTVALHTVATCLEQTTVCHWRRLASGAVEPLHASDDRVLLFAC